MDQGIGFFPRMETMATPQLVTTLRRGQFLWMDPAARRQYLHSLKRRIAEGYYNSDRVFSKVAEDIAPVLEEILGAD